MPLDATEELEEKISELVERHKRLRTEKEDIERRLLEIESESHHLRGRIRQYERERSELRDRLERILGRFDGLDLP